MNVKHIHTVPHLTTALTGPLLTIERLLLKGQAAIEAWFRSQWLETPAPFYCSVDLRNAGFKLAPVDTNLFPAGFNNLNPAFIPLCIQAIQAAVERVCPAAAKVLFIPENHTRNMLYFESVATLLDILDKAGFETRVGSLLDTVFEVDLPSGRRLHFEPLVRDGTRLRINGFNPCMILLNNDLSSGRPAVLENLEQPVIPTPRMGWSDRRKSGHFALYKEVAKEFSELINVDPWLFDPLFLRCGKVNFAKREGEECLATNVDTLVSLIRRKYDEYGIDLPPFVVVKADAGTYGMGVMTAYSGQDIRELNRKQRTSMSTTKGGQQINEVMMQEGVYSFETWGAQQAVAEPVIYMIDHYVVGGFYRIHTARGPSENLNAPGMQFEPLMFAECCNAPDRNRAPDAHPNRFYAYGVIARLALVAAARESIQSAGQFEK